MYNDESGKSWWHCVFTFGEKHSIFYHWVCNELVAVDLLQRYKMLFWFKLRMAWKVMWLRHDFSRWAVGRYLGHKDSELISSLYILIESHFDGVGRWWDLAKVGKQATRGLYVVLVSFALPSASWLSWAEEQRFYYMPPSMMCLFSGWLLWG